MRENSDFWVFSDPIFEITNFQNEISFVLSLFSVARHIRTLQRHISEVKTQSTPRWKLLSKKPPTDPVLRVADPTGVVPDQFGGAGHAPPCRVRSISTHAPQSTRRGPTVQLTNLPSRPLEVKTARDGSRGAKGRHDKRSRRVGWCRYAP